jgi:PIN domain nuclease of toxin-antitoxin system
MRVVLDSHAFLWAIDADSRLSRRAEQIITGPNELLLSVASVWEMLIKAQTGKLRLPSAAGAFIVREMAKNRVEALPISLDHVLRLESLPLHHRDPFDRLIIAQCLVEKLPVVTADAVFDRYPVDVIW